MGGTCIAVHPDGSPNASLLVASEANSRTISCGQLTRFDMSAAASLCIIFIVTYSDNIIKCTIVINVIQSYTVERCSIGIMTIYFVISMFTKKNTLLLVCEWFDGSYM